MSDTVLIDRIPTLELFRAMLDGAQHERILRVTGTEKMGKTRLLREYRRIAEQDYHTRCALIDLRSKLQNHDDFLYAISQQIGVAYFPKYHAVHDDLAQQTSIQVSNIRLILSQFTARSEQDEDRVERQRRRLTDAFVQDLQMMPPSLPVVLLFDAFEQANDTIQAWLNEQFLLGVCQLPHVYVVFAGRQLPEPLASWQSTCCSHELPPVGLEDHRRYCIEIGINVSDETLVAFHTAFDGRPGYFVEFASKLAMGA